MLTIDLIIGVSLISLGLLVLLFLSYVFTCQKQAKISALCVSEAFATLILGLFYVICSCLISPEHWALLTPQSDGNSTITIMQLNNLSIYDPAAVKTLRDLYNPNNFHTKPTNYSHLDFDPEEQRISDSVLAEFINYYKSTFGDQQEVLKNLIMANQGIRHQRSHFKPKQDEIVQDEDCAIYDEVYYKYIMLVVAFLYGSVSVINSSIECKNGAQPNGNCNDKVFISARDANESREASPSTCNRKSIAQVLAAWLVPIAYTILITLTMKPTSELVTQWHESMQNGSESEMVAIIAHPLNVTYLGMNSTREHEMNAVVDSIYRIMDEAGNNARLHINGAEEANTFEANRPTFDILQFLDAFRVARDRKSMRRMCRAPAMPIKLHTLLVFILSYISTVFYAKLTHTELSLKRVADLRHIKLFGKYVVGFAGMWLPAMLEVFVRTYLMDATPTIASDLTLALGNLTRVLANGMNIHTLHTSRKRLNNVQPMTECA